MEGEIKNNETYNLFIGWKRFNSYVVDDDRKENADRQDNLC